MQRLADALRERLLRDGTGNVSDDLPGAVDEERLRGGAHTPASEQAPVAVAPDRVCQPEGVDELARVAGEVLVVDADDDEPPADTCAPRSAAAVPRPGTARTMTPRS